MIRTVDFSLSFNPSQGWSVVDRGPSWQGSILSFSLRLQGKCKVLYTICRKGFRKPRVKVKSKLQPKQRVKLQFHYSQLFPKNNINLVLVYNSLITLIMPKEFVAWPALEFKGLLFVQTLLRSVLLSKVGKHPTDQKLRHCVHLPRAQSWILFV